MTSSESIIRVKFVFWATFFVSVMFVRKRMQTACFELVAVKSIHLPNFLPTVCEKSIYETFAYDTKPVHVT